MDKMEFDPLEPYKNCVGCVLLGEEDGDPVCLKTAHTQSCRRSLGIFFLKDEFIPILPVLERENQTGAYDNV